MNFDREIRETIEKLRTTLEYGDIYAALRHLLIKAYRDGKRRGRAEGRIVADVTDGQHL